MDTLTPELKKEIVEAYQASDPTPDTSIEIVKELAEQFERTPSSIRMILTKEEVYIKKAPAAGGEVKKSSGRVSKAESIQGLKDIMNTLGADIDHDIVDKLTGKAAAYFTEVLRAR